MIYKIGLIGLPNVGKSSLFHFLTRKIIKDIANYPFATIKPNIGMMTLFDPRLEKLSKFWKKPSVPSAIEIIDIAGLIKGASEGFGLGNEFLSHIREVDLICQVCRCFPEEDIIHVEKSVNPIRDLEIIQTELISADLQQIEKKIGKLELKNNKFQQEKEILQSIKSNLEKNKLIYESNFSEEVKKILKPYNFLTNKPMILLANYSSKVNEIKNLEKYAQQKKLDLFALAVKLEIELVGLTSIEKKEIDWKDVDFYLLTTKFKDLLNLKTFFTIGENEVKSWLIKKEAKASECAGLIHSEIQKNLFGVEVYNYEEWLKTSNKKILKKGIDYTIKEGDVCYFLFKKGKKKKR